MRPSEIAERVMHIEFVLKYDNGTDVEREVTRQFISRYYHPNIQGGQYRFVFNRFKSDINVHWVGYRINFAHEIPYPSVHFTMIRYRGRVIFRVDTAALENVFTEFKTGQRIYEDAKKSTGAFKAFMEIL